MALRFYLHFEWPWVETKQITFLSILFFAFSRNSNDPFLLAHQTHRNNRKKPAQWNATNGNWFYFRDISIEIKKKLQHMQLAYIEIEIKRDWARLKSMSNDYFIVLNATDNALIENSTKVSCLMCDAREREKKMACIQCFTLTISHSCRTNNGHISPLTQRWIWMCKCANVNANYELLFIEITVLLVVTVPINYLNIYDAMNIHGWRSI